MLAARPVPEAVPALLAERDPAGLVRGLADELLDAGASADASFRDGMAIFTVQKGGLMYEASIGGQRFSFRARE